MDNNKAKVKFIDGDADFIDFINAMKSSLSAYPNKNIVRDYFKKLTFQVPKLNNIIIVNSDRSIPFTKGLLITFSFDTAVSRTICIPESLFPSRFSELIE